MSSACTCAPCSKATSLNPGTATARLRVQPHNPTRSVPARGDSPAPRREGRTGANSAASCWEKPLKLPAADNGGWQRAQLSRHQTGFNHKCSQGQTTVTAPFQKSPSEPPRLAAKSRPAPAALCPSTAPGRFASPDEVSCSTLLCH